MSAGLNRRQLKFCRQRAQGASVAESARVAGCAESTAFAWERLPEVAAEIAALRGAATGAASECGEAKDDPETILRRSIDQCTRRGDHRAIAQLVAQLRLVLENRTANHLVEQLRAATPDELVAALSQCVDDPQTWSRIGDAAHARSTFGAMGLGWNDALALVLSGVWLRDEDRDAWRDQTAPLLELAGALARHPVIPAMSSTSRTSLREAIAGARAALDAIEALYAAPTDAADTEPAP